MAENKENQNLNTAAIRLAVKKLAKHQLHRCLKAIDGSEASEMLPEIWPIIQELCAIADAAEVNMIFCQVTEATSGSGYGTTTYLYLNPRKRTSPVRSVNQKAFRRDASS